MAMRVHTLAKMPSILLSFHPGKNSNTMMLTTISTARVTWNFCILFILIVFRSITFLSLSICCCKDRQKYQIWQTIGQKFPPSTGHSELCTPPDFVKSYRYFLISFIPIVVKILFVPLQSKT